MSSTLTITYAPAADTDEQEEYFITLEQVKAEDDTLTLAEAADLIDAAYDIDPCEDEDEDSDEDEDEEITDEDVQEFIDYIQGNLDLSVCELDEDGSYETEIKVYRSHLSLPYVLRLTAGEVISTVTETETVSESIDCDGQSYATLSRGYYGDLECDVPVKSILGSTVNFEEEQEGAVSLAYTSRYDLVTVKVGGSGGEPNDCTAFAFMSGLATDAVELEAPDVDEDITEEEEYWYCSAEVDFDGSGPDEVTCYKLQHRVTRCRCSGEELSRETVEVDCDCPRKEMHCPGSVSVCRALIGSETVTVGYSPCPSDEGEDTCGDPEVALEMCCGEAPAVQPPCCTVTEVYQGKKPDTETFARWRSIYGQNTRFVPVAPKDGICGELTTKYLAPDACCDGVSALSIVEDESDEVVAATARAAGRVVVSGGVTGAGKLLPLQVHISGEGFYIYGGHKSAEVEGRYVWLATENACGTGHLYVTDGCSSASYTIRSTSGHWELEKSGTGCEFAGEDIQELNFGVSYSGYVIKGDIKYAQIPIPTISICGAGIASIQICMEILKGTSTKLCGATYFDTNSYPYEYSDAYEVFYNTCCDFDESVYMAAIALDDTEIPWNKYRWVCDE